MQITCPVWEMDLSLLLPGHGVSSSGVGELEGNGDRLVHLVAFQVGANVDDMSIADVDGVILIQVIVEHLQSHCAEEAGGQHNVDVEDLGGEAIDGGVVAEEMGCPCQVLQVLDRLSLGIKKTGLI